MGYGTLKVDILENSTGMIASTMSPGFRNRVINGDMRIYQRNTAATADVTYSVDRWQIKKSNDASESVAQSTDAPTGFVYSLRNTVVTTDTSIGAAQYSALSQSIEGPNIHDWLFGTANARTLTLSFWIKSSVTGTYSGNLCTYNTEARIFVFSYTVNNANTWEYKTVTIPGDTSGTWSISSTGGATLHFYAALGSNFTGGVAGAWDVPSKYGVPQVNALATVGNIFAISGVQLEVGSFATSYDHRPFGLELLLCQRYYHRLVPTQTYGPIGVGRAWGSNNGNVGFYLPTSMRANPTITYSALSDFDVVGAGDPTGIQNDGSSQQATKVGYTRGVSSGSFYQFEFKTNLSAWLAFSAEM